ncbi:MAG: AMP-binding protein [Pseudomonadota bacterium]|nr:AMP-binding protein [Pseudomonadota bacterium]
MRKPDLIEYSQAIPELIFPLDELSYPASLNVVKVIYERAMEREWLTNAAIYCDGKSITYGELFARVKLWAGMLVTAGVKRGDCVLIRCPDSTDAVTAFLAIQSIGAVAVPAFAQLRVADLVYRVKDTSAVLALVSEEFAEEFLEVEVACPSLRTVVSLPEDPTGKFRTLSDFEEIVHTDKTFAETDSDDLALIAYTSGTTGRPKGTAHCHRDLLAASDTYGRHCIGTTPDDILAGPPSLPFTMGSAFFIYYALASGAAAILSADKSVQTYADLINKHGATIFIGVPTFYKQFIAYIQEQNIELSTLRMSLVGGEPLYSELEESWLRLTGLHLEQFIGSTEMFHIYIGYRHGVDNPRVGVLGKAIPGYEVTVRDPDTFEEKADGEHGLLCSKGPTSTAYWSPKEVQVEMVRDGWNIAKDTVWKDEEGYIHFVARADEMIVTGGFNVAPADVEQVLVRHPAVAECACVASPDDSRQRNHVVKAFVVLNKEHELTGDFTEMLQTYFKENGPPFMYPRKIEYVGSLPRGITGKLQRSELRRLELGE